MIAVPTDGFTVYRLARSDPPTLRDFQPPSRELADELAVFVFVPHDDQGKPAGEPIPHPAAS